VKNKLVPKPEIVKGKDDSFMNDTIQDTGDTDPNLARKVTERNRQLRVVS